MKKNPIIIIDGVDMCGKTEIAKKLSSKLESMGFFSPYFKNNKEREFFGTSGAAEYFKNTLRYGMGYFTNYLEQSGAGIVLDRCYPSEFVYSRLFSRETDHEALTLCDMKFSELNAKIILTYRTSYEGRSDDTHPELISSEIMEKLDSLYRQFASQSRCLVKMLNVDDENLEREVSECLEFVMGDTK